jgi:predicted enzyme related to lactoylglutathione lyase
MYLGGRGEVVLVLDCSDLDRSTEFWTEVLGYFWSGVGGNTYRSLVPADGVGIELLLQRVPDVKGVKNRLHLDLRTRDLAAEVARVCALGGTVLTREPLVEVGWVWHLLADPDGNELCVLQPPDDYWVDSTIQPEP